MSIAPKIGDAIKVNLIEIFRRYKFSSPNYLTHLGIVAAAGLCCAFTATLLGGTYYTAVISNDYAIVAIDSRSTDLRGLRPPNDSYCKVIPLSNDVLFFATGFVRSDESTGRVIFDAFDNAQLAYFRTSSKANLRGMADLWDDYMNISLRYVLATQQDISINLLGKPLINGFFVGIEEGGMMVISHADISLTIDGRLSTKLVTSWQSPGNSTPIFHGGHEDLILEFSGKGTTPRAQEATKVIDDESAGKSDIDTMAVRSSAFVKAVRDWSGDQGIGGEVAVMILERGKKWRWFHRPDHCPEN